MRGLFVIAHRWAGLTIALFLIVAGLTGSLLAFYHELHRETAPAFTQSEMPRGDAKPIDPLILRELAERLSGGSVTFADLTRAEGDAALFYVEPRPGQGELGFDEIALDPYSGTEQGRRTWGAISEGWHNIMPFIYKLHYTLALGDWGMWAFGLAALIWTIDCFVGLYLTLPIRRGKAVATARLPRPSWLSRWRPSWRIRWRANRSKLNFDLHRAGGLWIWPLLLVFAWSGVGFNLTDVYNPVMDMALGSPVSRTAEPLSAPKETPDHSWPLARKALLQLAKAEGERQGFTVTRPMWLRYNAPRGTWTMAVKSSRDILDHGGQTRLEMSDTTGQLVALELPTGQSARTTSDSWLFALHMAQVGGLTYRLIVCLLGLLITMLTVTGVIIWMKKRSARSAKYR